MPCAPLPRAKPTFQSPDRSEAVPRFQWEFKMLKKRTFWMCLATAMAFQGCSNDPQTDPIEDVDDTSDTTPDVPETEAPPNSVELGGLCNSDFSCKSAFCVKIGQGFNEGICTQRCDETADCDQQAWDCTTVNTGTGDDVSACIPANLCIDRDGDLYGIGPGCLGADCDDTNPLVNPGAPELCNGIDDNCDGTIDNQLVDTNRFCDTDKLGVCANGQTQCANSQLVCVPLQSPGREVCNGLDDDCDGLVDENQMADANSNFIVGIGTACQIAAPPPGACNIGERVCDPARGGIICASNGDPQDEICNGIDDNCDGQPDSGVANLGMPCSNGFGICQALGVNVCDPTDPLAPVLCDAQANSGNAGAEVCDYVDNNCDGQIDEDFKNDDGDYAFVENCGQCAINCVNLLGDNPADIHVVAACEPTGTSYTCGYTCVDGWVDADGDESNGCELQPDGQGIYVNTPQKGGANTSTCGAWNFPCATIAYGQQRAQTENRARVRVGQGIYREGVRVIDGISLLGGHNALNWTRDRNTYATIISGAVADITTDSVSVVAHDISSATEVSGFTISAPDGRNGGSSIAVWVKNATSALVLQQNNLVAGIGGQGSTGAPGTNGARGPNGSVGVPGVAANGACNANRRSGGNGGATACGTMNVAGGAGSDGICADYGQAAASPAPGASVPGGGAPGEAGLTAWGRGYDTTACTNAPAAVAYNFPRDGQAGGLGVDGNGGAGAANATGSVDATGLWRATVGGLGIPGTPGGGGGGGGAAHSVQACTSSNTTGMTGCNANADRWIGSSGGGGGAGGCAGAQAQGGRGGGGSFALLLTHDGTSTLPLLTGNTLTRNFAGQGGDGGLGGTGGSGGRGGDGGEASLGDPALNFCMKSGRRGGDGGRGGHGGGGGGGAGGNSYDIVVSGVSAAQRTVLQNQNTSVVDAATATSGIGGPGGGSMGKAGLPGVQGASGRILSF